ncbi:MAG TPA: hypothetical protein VGF06_14855, partial [Terriglobales bacterium]
IIEADGEFQAKLRALKNSAGVARPEARTYEFILTTALETLDSSADDHRQLLQEQVQFFKDKKNKK